MNVNFRDAETKDKEFILDANKEINILSGLNDSTLDNNIDKDLFKDNSCKAIMVEVDNQVAGFVLYSYIYWANCGKGIYLSQAYVKEEYRRHGLLNKLLQELETREKECRFITSFVGNENEVMINSINKLGFKTSDLTIYYRLKKEAYYNEK